MTPKPDDPKTYAKKYVACNRPRKYFCAVNK